jgi:hypothetical protein
MESEGVTYLRISFDGLTLNAVNEAEALGLHARRQKCKIVAAGENFCRRNLSQPLS